jgi:hypothetical protein
MAKASANENAPGIGHNGELTSDQRQCLALAYRREHRPLIDAKKKADADIKAWGRRLKADLGSEGKIEVATLIAMETDEGAEKIDAEIKAKTRARGWASPSDMQLGLFPEKEANGETKAYNAGKISGMDDEPLDNPYGAGTSDHEDYARGHQDGCAVLAEISEMRAASEEAAELIKGSDGEDLDDEQDAA